MKSRKFPTFNEAKAYIEERGEVQFYGRAGLNYEYCVYTLTIGVIVYMLNIHNDGLLEVTGERYK